eukprot:4472089-Pleurochrysis_carterae.AAC.1
MVNSAHEQYLPVSRSSSTLLLDMCSSSHFDVVAANTAVEHNQTTHSRFTPGRRSCTWLLLHALRRKDLLELCILLSRRARAAAVRSACQQPAALAVLRGVRGDGRGRLAGVCIDLPALLPPRMHCFAHSFVEITIRKIHFSGALAYIWGNGSRKLNSCCQKTETILGGSSMTDPGKC